jgi:hypothetical protein
MEQAAVAKQISAKPGFRAHPSDHRFFQAMSILAAAVTLTGFGSKYPSSPEFPPIIHIHAAIFTSWLLLLIVQAFLVGRGRIDLHRCQYLSERGSRSGAAPPRGR